LKKLGIIHLPSLQIGNRTSRIWICQGHQNMDALMLQCKLSSWLGLDEQAISLGQELMDL